MRRAIIVISMLCHTFVGAQEPVIAASIRPLGTPFAEEAFWATALAMPPTFKVHGLFNVNVTDQFITNYGLNLENQGVMIQPHLLLSTHVYANRLSWITEAVVTGGVWSTWNSRLSGNDPGHWRELDAYGGLTLTLARDWKLSAFYSAYMSQTASFPTAWDLAIALTLDDSRWLREYALHPFIEFRRQTEGRNNFSLNQANTDESYMFKLGISPSHTFSNGLKLEWPIFATLMPDGFYQHLDGRAASGGVGFVSAAFKATMPLRRLSTARLGWSVYGAVQFYHLTNSGLLETNQALNASSKQVSEFVQFHAGLTLNF
jgi:hypothetical protein